jgi:hypothetical protein
MIFVFLGLKILRFVRLKEVLKQLSLKVDFDRCKSNKLPIYHDLILRKSISKLQKSYDFAV